LEYLFYILIFLVFYSYIGYLLLLFVLVQLKNLFQKNKSSIIESENNDLPELTLVIPAYNEIDFIDLKMLQNKKYQNQFLELYPILNKDKSILLENVLTGEVIAIIYHHNAKKFVISSLFKEEEYEILENIKNNFQKEIKEYLKTL